MLYEYAFLFFLKMQDSAMKCRQADYNLVWSWVEEKWKSKMFLSFLVSVDFLYFMRERSPCAVSDSSRQ